MAPGSNQHPNQRGGGGGGRGGGRNGRFNHSRNQGRGGGNKSSNQTSKSNDKKYIFAPHSTGRQANATYHSTVEHICQKIQETFTNGYDIAKSLRDNEKVDLSLEEPTRAMATTGTAEEKALIQSGLDIKYQAEITAHATRVQTLEANWRKAFALIMNVYCTSTMRQRLGEHPEYHTKIMDDPLMLLETIISCMHEPIRSQYPLVSPVDYITQLLTCKQGTYPAEESLLDYSKRFKQELNLTNNFIGKAALDHYVESLDGYLAAAYRPTADEEADLPDEAQWKETPAQLEIKSKNWKAFEAYLFIRGCDPSKYGSFVKNLASQYSLGNDQYPKTLQAAVDAFQQHRYDPKYFELKKKDRERRSNNNNNNTSGNSESMPSQQTSFAQTQPPRSTANRNANQAPPGTVTTAICHCCGQAGHISKYCPDLNNIAKSNWYIRRAIAAYQEPESTVTQDDSDGEESQQTLRSTRSTQRTAASTPSSNSRSAARTRGNDRAGNGQGFQFFQFAN